MMDLPWPQISGAIAGGLFGGFSGFVAKQPARTKGEAAYSKNVACALIGEIEALRRRTDNHVATGHYSDLQA